MATKIKKVRKNARKPPRRTPRNERLEAFYETSKITYSLLQEILQERQRMKGLKGFVRFQDLIFAPDPNMLSHVFPDILLCIYLQ